MNLRINPEELIPKPGARERIYAAGKAYSAPKQVQVRILCDCAEQRTYVEAADLLSVVFAFAMSAMMLGVRFRQTSPKIESLAIIDQVAAKHGLTVEDMTGPRRMPMFVRARQEAMYRLYAERDNLSMPMIAHLLGLNDHTTVVHGIRAHAARFGLPVPKRNHSANCELGWHTRKQVSE